MRLKALVVLLISFCFVKLAQSQSNELLIQGETGKLYLEHTVSVKENWYSIGRLYNISPKEVAPFNKLTMAQALTVGQQIQIPLTAANFSQNGVKMPAETLVPLYHVIQDKEWMYRISVNYDKVPISNLEKWNNINKDQVKAGMHLIVGYLKVKTALSALAVRGSGTSFAANAISPGGLAGGSSGTGPGETDGSLPKGVAAPGGSSTAGVGSKSTNPVPAKAPVITATVAPSTSIGASSKEDPKVAVHTSPAASVAGTPAIHFNGGYFRNEFADGDKSTTGSAGIFKSTSGWQDGKYYALMNNVAVGTIVKVNVPSTGRSIYAKVLGQLPDMKESGGLTVRISNAAASELGQGDGKFAVELKY